MWFSLPGHHSEFSETCAVTVEAWKVGSFLPANLLLLTDTLSAVHDNSAAKSTVYSAIHSFVQGLIGYWSSPRPNKNRIYSRCVRYVKAIKINPDWFVSNTQLYSANCVFLIAYVVSGLELFRFSSTTHIS